MRELAVQSANDTNTDTDRAELQKELAELTEEITRISSNTEFNEKNLLDGSVTDGFTVHIGAIEGQSIKLEIVSMSAGELGVEAVDISDQASADAAITTFRSAIDTL